MEISARNFDQEVLQADKPVLVDFWGSWCIPCKQMEPTLRKLEDSGFDLEVFQVNVNRNPRLRARYHILGVPTFILFQAGQERGRVVGSQSPDQLIGFIEDHLD
ncbi:MAG: thioredoxin family protein [Armatimonadota bacterium]|nr:thioredoxin family protein [Armatimonadota bacterium]